MNDLERRVHTAIKECYDVVIAPTYELGSALAAVFMKIHGRAPHRATFRSDYYAVDLPEGREWSDAESKGKIESISKGKSIDYWATQHNLLKLFPDAVHIRWGDDYFLFTDEYIIDLQDLEILMLNTDDIPKEIVDCLVYKEAKATMEYVTYSNQGFRTTLMKVKEQDCDIQSNYNDDLPHQQITDMINSKESGIAILHGVSGCGKTSYIRKLIADNPGKKFVFLDASTFQYIGDASFIELLTNKRDSVFVVEDCEDLLVSRDTKGNHRISSLLNLSDGILGDSLNLKFICTFNADISSTDKALLRKGRLKVKYEFGKLTKDKATALAVKLGKTEPVTEDMALCDVYNLGTDNGGEQIESDRPKIGFR